MKTAPKLKAEKNPPSLKADTKKRRASAKSTSKSNGKHLLVSYEHAPIGIVEASLEGKHLNVNEEFCHITGYDKAELLQGGIKDFTYEEDYPIDVKLHGQLVEGKIPFYKLEKRYVRKDGGIIWVELTRSIVRDGDGKPLYTIGVVLDISERKHVERVLRDSSERLRLATQTAQMFMWEWDFESQTYTLPDNFTQVLGFSPGLLSKNGVETVQRFLPAEDLQSFLNAYTEAVRNKRDLHSLPCRVINHENGQIVWLEVSAKIVYDHEGKPERMFGVAQNITESKQREEALGESEERFRALVSQATAGIAQTDLTGRFTFVNPKLCGMLGYSETQLMGKTIWEITYGDDLEENKKLFEQMVSQGESYQFEKRFIRSDGSLLWANVSVSAIRDLTGKPKGGVGVVVDISERKSAEQALAESARQQEALYRLADQLNRTNSLEDGFTAALDAILNVLQCDRASILLFDHENVMRFVAWRGLSDAYRKATEGHSPWKADEENPQPISMNDVRTAELSDSLRAVIKEEGIESLAFIPLVANGKLLGKFMVYFNTPHVFSEAEIELSQTIAHQLAFDVDRERAEDNLRESEERYRVVVESQSEMLCRFQSDGTILFVNGAYARACGATLEVLIGRNFWEFIAEADRPALKAMLDRLTPDVPEVHIENRFKTAEGERWTLWTNRALRFDSNGRVLEVQSSGIDITDRIANENALRASEEENRRLNEELQARLNELNALLEILPTGVWIGNSDCSLITGNPAAYRILGLTPGTNVSVTNPQSDMPTGLKIFVNGEEISPQNAPMQVVARSGKPWHNFEHELLFPDGTQRAVYGSVVPLLDQYGAVRKVIGTYTDFTERKQAEKRLALLAEISELTRKIEDSNELSYAVAKAVGEHLQVKRCLFNEIDLENDREVVYLDYYHGVPSVAGVHKLSDYSRITSAEMRAGKTVVNHDSKTDSRTAQDYERTYGPNQERAYVAIPLMRENRWVASFWVSDDRPREWSIEDVSLLETIAERTWTVIEKLRIDTALRESEALYRAIARSIPGGGVYVVDKDFRYLVAEGVVTEAFGLSRESLEGHTVSEVFTGEIKEKLEERFARAFAGEITSSETVRNGRVYWSQYAPLADSIGQAIVVTQDITERKQMEEALRQSEERFARFMQHLPGLAWIKDLQGRYVYANVAAEKAFNTPLEKLFGKTDAEVFPPEVATQFMQNDQRALIEGTGVQVIETLKQTDGVLHSSLVSKFPIPGPDDQIALIGGTAFDITERLQAEDALRESKERYRNLFDLVPVAVYTCDANGLIQEYNHRAVELWGREPKKNDPDEKYCGSFKLYYPDGRFMPHEECPMARMLRGETLKPYELEILVERPDGARRNVIPSPLVLRNERGEVIGAINCLYDITERKQAEEALRESEERFSAILSQATAGIVRKDAQGRFVYVNQAFCNMLGYTEADLIGKTVWSFMHEEDIEASRRSFHRLMMEGVPFKLERRFLRADRSVIWVDASVSPIMDVAGRPQSAVAVEVDITGRKQAEESLQQLNLQLESRVETRTAELQAANKALQESRKRLQILSQRLVDVQEEERRALARELHDRVGQTLAALNINLIIINGQLSTEAAEQIGTRLQDSMKLVAETIALVRDVMTDLRPAVLDDYGLEAALESHLEQFMSRYEIKAKLEKPDHSIPRLGPSLEMTFLRIAQEALMNIARHAKASEVKLSLRQEPDAIVMTVQDNGIGIESWQEANRPGSHGLTIMRERAEAFGGTLQVRSVPGQGTKVQVSIPLKSQKEIQE